MLIDLRKLIRALPIKRGKAFLIRKLSLFFASYRYDMIKVFGHPIRIDLMDNSAIGLYLNYGEIKFEKEIFSILEAIVEPGDVFWDVGANIGYYTLYLAGKCSVVSFEPNPILFSYLKDSVSTDQNVSVFAYALSNENKEINFFINEGSSDLSSIINNGLKKTILVESKTVDYLIMSEGFVPPTIIKIDVEGFEYYVLDGFKSINKYVPVLIFEYIEDFGKEINKTLDDLINILGPEWSIFRFMKNGKIMSNYKENNESTNNYLAVHKSFNRLNKIKNYIL